MRWRVPPCTSVLRPRRRLQQERHLLNAQHARQPARLAHNREPAGKIRPVERHAEKEAQGRDRAVDARRLHAALRLVELEAAQSLCRRGIGRAANEGRKCPDIPNVVVARLLAEAAHAHVLDHARPQRADGPMGRIGGHRGSSLKPKVAGPSMLGIGCPDRHALLLTHPPPSPKMYRSRRPSSRESGFVHRPTADPQPSPWEPLFTPVSGHLLVDQESAASECLTMLPLRSDAALGVCAEISKDGGWPARPLCSSPSCARPSRGSAPSMESPSSGWWSVRQASRAGRNGCRARCEPSNPDRS